MPVLPVHLQHLQQRTLQRVSLLPSKRKPRERSMPVRLQLRNGHYRKLQPSRVRLHLPHLLRPIQHLLQLLQNERLPHFYKSLYLQRRVLHEQQRRLPALPQHLPAVFRPQLQPVHRLLHERLQDLHRRVPVQHRLHAQHSDRPVRERPLPLHL